LAAEQALANALFGAAAAHCNLFRPSLPAPPPLGAPGGGGWRRRRLAAAAVAAAAAAAPSHAPQQTQMQEKEMKRPPQRCGRGVPGAAEEDWEM